MENNDNYEHLVLGEGNPLHPNNQETVLDLTPSEQFYEIENPSQEECLAYIHHLEQKNKAMKKEVKQIHDEMESTGKLTSYINRLWKIYKLNS